MSLQNIRKKIDEIDQKLITLLNDRMGLALEVGKIKSENGREIYAPEREAEIYQMIDALKDCRLSKDSLKAIYREVMSASLALEKPLTVVYLGPEATFTHMASISKFGASVKYQPASSIYEVFQEVEHKRADYGVVPVENSIEGGVTHSLDMFMDSDLKICSEIYSEITHNLMSNSKREHIRKIYSKDQVFGQCRAWLEGHYPGVELIETGSTTIAAQKAAREDGAAAIASKHAATIYNLPILNEGIQDYAQNVTRFLVVGRKMAGPTRRDKTSILVSIKDKVGALYEMLQPIRKAKLNMTKIESRPSKKKAWDYFFFIDFEGHVASPRVAKMLRDMEGKTKFVKVLGSYPMVEGKEY